MRLNVNVPGIAEARSKWVNLCATVLRIAHAFFIDETGLYTNCQPNLGWSYEGTRISSDAPIKREKNRTVIGAVNMYGDFITDTYEGGTTSERFIAFLKKLKKSMGPDDFIIMDNMRTHHSKAVMELLDKEHIKALYLPAYSPDFNPIERVWSLFKGMVRKFRPINGETLLTAISQSLSAISATKIMNIVQCDLYTSK